MIIINISESMMKERLDFARTTDSCLTFTLTSYRILSKILYFCLKYRFCCHINVKFCQIPSDMDSEEQACKYCIRKVEPFWLSKIVNKSKNIDLIILVLVVVPLTSDKEFCENLKHESNWGSHVIVIYSGPELILVIKSHSI